MKMQIINVPIGELKPYENNPRVNDKAIEYVAESIREFGFKVPIIVDENGVIVAGHTRYLAAKELGMETVPTIMTDDLTPEQVKAFRIADNKTAEKASWDDALLKEELSDILDDFDMTEFGFGDFELSILTEDFEPEPYDEEVIEEYSGDENKLLEKRRVIITYKEDQEGAVLNLLGLEAFDKVVYDITELKA